ncbi:Fur family ferric uptake transcriptional regulator [Deinococcus sp. HSC-46F16]|uniref:Fur family transcriptional regulator n=1 Tax=Deinococcus sp. HSC-46F16 TaxID=2910968 RepID=UPI00209D0E70|nr:transcriptional repressor [Deinococcus sp. HSC-46F16]MCP2014300.1 Fur family ferric uptake transcriptional regulator [Deinococcus sp. HSC-46F16]
MTMVRQTRQRQAVIEVLRGSREHPDAAWIHGRVREALPQVSLGTVYRTLDALVRDGVVVTIERAGQATRYDYKHAGHDHHHAVCRCCGAIFDVEAAAVPVLPPSALPAGFQVTDVRLEFMGVCPDCGTQPPMTD